MLYNIVKSLLSGYMKIFRRVRVTGLENIPKEGSVFIIANHSSAWDPVILLPFFKREINYMCKQELFEIPVLKTLLKNNYVFPIKRGELDRIAIKKAMSVLKEGKILGVFPEGTRNDGKELLPFKPGVSFIASRQETTILPIGIFRAGDILKFWKKPIEIKIGKPFSSIIEGEHNSKESMNLLLEKQICAIENLFYINDENNKLLD